MLARSTGWIILTLCVTSGCVSSENGLAPLDSEKVDFDPALLGDWAYADPSGGSQGGSLRIERLDEKGLNKSYALTWTTDGQVAPVPDAQRYRGVLVVVGDSRYLDFTSTDQTQGGRHTFFKVKLEKASLTLQFWNPSYFPSHPTALAYRFDENGSGWFPTKILVLTANSPEICRFLEEHQQDSELWIDELTTKFKRL